MGDETIKHLKYQPAMETLDITLHHTVIIQVLPWASSVELKFKNDDVIIMPCKLPEFFFQLAYAINRNAIFYMPRYGLICVDMPESAPIRNTRIESQQQYSHVIIGIVA